MVRSALVAAILGFAFAIPAGAGTLATGAMFRGDLTALFACEAVNVGDKPIKSVTVRLVPFVGPSPPEATCTDLAPGSVCFTNTFDPTFFSGHCKIDFTGGKRNIRGAMSVIAAGNNVQEQLPAQ